MGLHFRINSKGIEYSHTVEECAPSDVLATRHCHDDYEILYVTSGRGRYILEGAEFPLFPRTLVIIKPFEYHYVEIEQSAVYERYVIHFSLQGFSKDTASLIDKILGENGEKSGCFYSPGTLSANAISVFDRFEAAASLDDAEKGIYLKLLLGEMLLFLSVSSGQHIVHGEDELGARVIRYINEYIDKN